MRRCLLVLFALALPLHLTVQAAAADSQLARPRQPRAPEAPRSRAVPKDAEVRSRWTGLLTERPVVAPAAPRATPAPAPAPRARPAPASVSERVAAAWPGDDTKALRVVACESNFVPSARSRSGRYTGLWQFDRPTWASVGGSGEAGSASVEEQTRRAWTLYQRAGWGPWPVCGRR